MRVQWPRQQVGAKGNAAGIGQKGRISIWSKEIFIQTHRKRTLAKVVNAAALTGQTFSEWKNQCSAAGSKAFCHSPPSRGDCGRIAQWAGAHLREARTTVNGGPGAMNLSRGKILGYPNITLVNWFGYSSTNSRAANPFASRGGLQTLRTRRKLYAQTRIQSEPIRQARTFRPSSKGREGRRSSLRLDVCFLLTPSAAPTKKGVIRKKGRQGSVLCSTGGSACTRRYGIARLAPTYYSKGLGESKGEGRRRKQGGVRKASPSVNEIRNRVGMRKTTRKRSGNGISNGGGEPSRSNVLAWRPTLHFANLFGAIDPTGFTSLSPGPRVRRVHLQLRWHSEIADYMDVFVLGLVRTRGRLLHQSDIERAALSLDRGIRRRIAGSRCRRVDRSGRRRALRWRRRGSGVAGAAVVVALAVGAAVRWKPFVRCQVLLQLVPVVLVTYVVQWLSHQFVLETKEAMQIPLETQSILLFRFPLPESGPDISPLYARWI